MIVSDVTIEIASHRSVTLCTHDTGVVTLAVEDRWAVAVTEIDKDSLTFLRDAINDVLNRG